MKSMRYIITRLFVALVLGMLSFTYANASNDPLTLTLHIDNQTWGDLTGNGFIACGELLEDDGYSIPRQSKGTITIAVHDTACFDIDMSSALFRDVNYQGQQPVYNLLSLNYNPNYSDSHDIDIVSYDWGLGPVAVVMDDPHWDMATSKALYVALVDNTKDVIQSARGYATLNVKNETDEIIKMRPFDVEGSDQMLRIPFDINTLLPGETGKVIAYTTPQGDLLASLDVYSDTKVAMLQFVVGERYADKRREFGMGESGVVINRFWAQPPFQNITIDSPHWSGQQFQEMTVVVR